MAQMPTIKDMAKRVAEEAKKKMLEMELSWMEQLPILGNLI